MAELPTWLKVANMFGKASLSHSQELDPGNRQFKIFVWRIIHRITISVCMTGQIFEVHPDQLLPMLLLSISFGGSPWWVAALGREEEEVWDVRCTPG